MRTSDEGRNYTLHFFIGQHRHRPKAQDRYAGRLTRRQAAKGTVETTQNRAGATPLCAAFSRPKGRGVAPARPEQLGGRVLSACTDRSRQFVMQVVLHRKREKEEDSCHY